MVKKKVLRRKHTYWHQLAKFLILNGFKPTMIGHILKDVFPETEVNGRHVGAYKRRLIKDEDIIDNFQTKNKKDHINPILKKSLKGGLNPTDSHHYDEIREVIHRHT